MSETPRVTDAMWQEIEAILAEHDPPARLGRKRVPQRQVIEALAHKLVTGCAWNNLPPEICDDGTAHRTMQRWQRLGVYDAITDVLAPANSEGAAA